MKFSVFCISIVLVVCFVSSGACLELCSELYRCSQQDDPVWTTSDGGRTCQVYRNPCLLGMENCNRRNLNEPEAVVKERKECLCDEECEDRMYSPLCAIRDDGSIQFGCVAEVNNYVCKTGKTFDEVRRGKCKPIPVKRD